MRLLILVALALTVFSIAPATASCRWEWVCDEDGDCAQVPLCERSFDIVPPQPPSIEPIVPPSIRPIDRPTLPPIGATDCTQARRRDTFGRWYWDTVCY